MKKQNHTSFAILEIATVSGGNSVSGKNEYTEFPWAAHYLPLPNEECTELLEFLKEAGTITGMKNNLPEFNETHLCFDPHERLFIHGKWQEGLIPEFGLTQEDHLDIRKFLSEMEKLKYTKGADGKFAFAIPVDNSSSDKQFSVLDSISAEKYLVQNGYKSPYLKWYVDYCCKDDFGTAINETSAWAALHYFAARRGVASNAESGSVLTWPEGNTFLARKLAESSSSQIRTSTMVYKAERKGNGKHKLYCYNVKTQQSFTIETKNVISCIPQYLNARIFATYSIAERTEFSYSPWVIANIKVSRWPYPDNKTLPWDNVMYNSPSLGYVDATHQNMQIDAERKTFTWYYAVADRTPSEGRKWLRERTHRELSQLVIEDLEKSHPAFTQFIEQIDFRIWGHAMIRPVPGFLWTNAQRKNAANTETDNLYFAHSDLGGISIFEQAFYSGIKAAQTLVSKLK